MNALTLDWQAFVRALERLGPILWEPGREGEAGWAICPCCLERNLWIEIKPVLVVQQEDDE